ncbi:MAG: response regulator [Candidatus Eremiobacterota bacterium]
MTSDQKVLLVEDSAADALLIRTMVGDDPGFSLHHVERLTEALRHLESAAFHLVLADLTLPDACGLSTVERLCQAAPEVPVVVLTGLQDERAALEAVRLGAQDYLNKSDMDSRLLLRVMRYAIERMRSQARLRESEERFRQLAETIEKVFWMTDADRSQVLYLSPTYEHIWGTPVSEARCEPLADLERIHPEDHEAVHRVLNTNRQGPYDVIYRLIAGDRQVRWIRERAFPVRDDQGRVVRVVGACEDITEQRSLEEQLQQAQKMESVGRLAGGVAHDFNNLLTAILGYSGLLLSQFEPGDPRREDLEEVEKAGFRARDLTRQLLAFSRKQILHPRAMDLNAAISELERMLRRIIGADVEMVLDLSASRAVVHADPGQIQQVLMNLTVNARDAMPDGGTLTIATRDAGDQVCLSVSDNGHGMEPEVLRHIFEPFYTTKAELGTGLGLSTVFGIVQQSGGRIEANSHPGQGTRFDIHLPLAARDALVEPRPPDALLGGSERILVVDDEPMVLRFATRTLERLGYRVTAASSAPEALAASSESPDAPHLLLTDVVMPRVSGVELARSLRQRLPELRIMLMSGYTEERAQLESLGPDVRFLQKPFSAQELLYMVRSMLDSES